MGLREQFKKETGLKAMQWIDEGVDQSILIPSKSYINWLEAKAGQVDEIVICDRLQTGEKLICFRKGGGYGDVFTVRGNMLHHDKSGSLTPLNEIDLSYYKYK